MLVSHTILSGLVALAVSSSWVTSGQTADPMPMRRAQNRLNAYDRKFINMASFVNMAEIKLGQVASKRGTTEKVRDFGAMMVKDHTMAQNKLTAIAQVKGATVPKMLDAKHRALYNRLIKLNGPAFDRAYMDAMEKGHGDAYRLLNEGLKKCRDNELKDYAKETAPVVKMHLDHAKDGH